MSTNLFLVKVDTPVFFGFLVAVSLAPALARLRLQHRQCSCMTVCPHSVDRRHLGLDTSSLMRQPRTYSIDRTFALYAGGCLIEPCDRAIGLE